MMLVLLDDDMMLTLSLIFVIWLMNSMTCFPYISIPYNTNSLKEHAAAGHNITKHLLCW